MNNNIRTLVMLSIITATAGTAPAFAEAMQIAHTPESIKAVNHLIARYGDAVKGYRDAADEIDDAGLKAQLLKKADQRQEYSNKLQSALANLGEKYNVDGGTTEGAVFRAWINLKATVTGQDDLAVMNAVRTGEEEAVKSYQGVLGEPLPEGLRKDIQNQFEEVLESYTWVNDEVKDRSKDRIADQKDQRIDDLKNKTANR